MVTGKRPEASQGATIDRRSTKKPCVHALTHRVSKQEEILTYWVLVHILEFASDEVSSLAPFRGVCRQWQRAIQGVYGIYSIGLETPTQHIAAVGKAFGGLARLDITSNRKMFTEHLTRSLPDLVHSRSLREIRLTRCPHLTNTGLVSLGVLTQLESLDLSDCTTITDLTALRMLSNVRTLRLNNCRAVSVIGLEPLQHLTRLRSLELAGIHSVTNDCLRSLSTLVSLHHLDLSECECITDCGISALATLTELRHLTVYGCMNLTDQSLDTFGRRLGQLRHLDVADCRRLSDAGLWSLDGLGFLQHLDVSGCTALTDGAMEPLANLKALTSLNLSHCPRVTWNGRQRLGILPGLRPPAIYT
jgi:hypothetical protein